MISENISPVENKLKGRNVSTSLAASGFITLVNTKRNYCKNMAIHSKRTDEKRREMGWGARDAGREENERMY